MKILFLTFLFVISALEFSRASPGAQDFMIGGDLSEKKVIAQIIYRLRQDCSECRFRVREVVLPPREVTRSLRTWSLGRFPEIRGSFQIPLLLTYRDGRNRNVWISGNVERLKYVPTTKRQIAMGERIQTGDIEWAWRDVSFSQDTAPSAEQLAHSRMKQTMASGKTIWQNSISPEPAVQVGESVRVSLGNDLWEVSTQAIARQSGVIGDEVNVSSGRPEKILRGTIIDKGKVKLR